MDDREKRDQSLTNWSTATEMAMATAMAMATTIALAREAVCLVFGELFVALCFVHLPLLKLL